MLCVCVCAREVRVRASKGERGTERGEAAGKCASAGASGELSFLLSEIVHVNAREGAATCTPVVLVCLSLLRVELEVE